MSPRKKSTKETVALYVRLPESLHAWIRDLAERERRSLNSQVVVLLQAAKDAQQPPTH